MEALGKRLAESGQLRDVGAPVELRLREPESVWALEPAASPPVRAGKATDPQTVLTLREEDFVQLLRGEARIDALYQHGKLRIDGELRPARALSFLSGLGR
jgi:3-hydroxyacyl-CoA dehydrogenase/3a,7a,12a-trihydroxy-5b-cholest-24-enoyl-CoA hydratase